ncbi:MAG: hypothetical protein IT353_22840 [Gemmatimonadaceae bacterium]|nr:hypothetical protein [Gemmatimonadaceae bacterium]
MLARRNSTYSFSRFVRLAALVVASAGTATIAASQQLSLRTGFVHPSEGYQRACGHSSISFGADVQGSGLVYPQLSVDRFLYAGGGDVACVYPGSATGGFRLEGANRAAVGLGGRTAPGAVQLEGALLGGLAMGYRGFMSSRDDRTRVRVPHVEARGNMVFFRHAVLSVSYSRMRVTTDIVPPASSVVDTRRQWLPLMNLQLGVRFGRF